MLSIEKLKAIKVRKQADKETIAEVIRFMEDIQKYREIQNYALSLIGFEPILREKMNSNDEDM